MKFPGPPKECAIPLFTNMQGQRDAGRLNYDMIHKVLSNFNCVRSPVDYGCYSKSFKERIAYVLLSTDDFLGLFPKMSQFDEFTEQLQDYFPIKIMKGSIIHFLNTINIVGEQDSALTRQNQLSTFAGNIGTIRIS